MSGGALLVAGTTSDAGKSILVAGLCRWLHRQGVKVAPFKAQNMANNSAVTPDGAEIGRAQAMQAAAAGIEPEAAMNPVLLKPGSDSTAQVVVMGQPLTDVSALSYRDLKPHLMTTVTEALADLRRRYDVVVCEGAGSPAEINLRDTDIANMGLARAAELPTLIVGDIDRGGVFAAMYGTVALLSREDQALVAGFVVNKFRGDVRLLDPGLEMLRSLTGRPVFGVLPWLDGLRLDVEDSLGLAQGDLVPNPGSHRGPLRQSDWHGGPLRQSDWHGGPLRQGGAGGEVLRVAVVRLPRISNFTDVDALSCEPGVVVRFVSTPAEIADADLVVLPGSRATVSDLAWLRATGLADVVTARAAARRPVLGICGGYQMLARTIVDEVESRSGAVAGLGLLPASVRFVPAKTLARPTGSAYGEPVTAYEIHHGVVSIDDSAESFLDGCRVGAVWGTTWHGAFENDGFRRGYLREVAALAGRSFVPDPNVCFAAVREARLDALGDAVSEHLDGDAIWRLLESGPPASLPFVPPGAP